MNKPVLKRRCKFLFYGRCYGQTSMRDAVSRFFYKDVVDTVGSFMGGDVGKIFMDVLDELFY